MPSATRGQALEVKIEDSTSSIYELHHAIFFYSIVIYFIQGEAKNLGQTVFIDIDDINFEKTSFIYTVFISRE